MDELQEVYDAGRTGDGSCRLAVEEQIQQFDANGVAGAVEAGLDVGDTGRSLVMIGDEGVEEVSEGCQRDGGSGCQKGSREA